MKILIGEDEVLLANSLKTLLEKKGFTVEVAYDGEAGKDYAETGVYDLLILDHPDDDVECIIEEMWVDLGLERVKLTLSL